MYKFSGADITITLFCTKETEAFIISLKELEKEPELNLILLIFTLPLCGMILSDEKEGRQVAQCEKLEE